jgi:alpha-1,2-mannosyltransferase
MTGRPRPAQIEELIARGAILAVIGVYLWFGLSFAQSTLGCDFLAYYNASVHWIHGQPIYDLAQTSTGTCGTYQYPPPFVLLAAPFSFLGFDVGNWTWIALLMACFAAGTALMPVRSSTRWIVLLLGAIGWPLIFGVRIGQVAPILYVLFAVAWRSLDDARGLGAAIALGTLVKLQPALLGVWLLVRRERRAAMFATVTGLVIVVAAAIVGLRDWLDLIALLRNLSDALTQASNVALGAVLYQVGVPAAVAGPVQSINTIVVVLAVVAVGLRLPREAGFLATVVATQLVSPIVWTHYALALLLPVAWLIDRRQWWALVIPISQAWVLIPFQANWWYTAAFYGAFVAVVAVGWRDLRTDADAAVAARSRLQAHEAVA